MQSTAATPRDTKRSRYLDGLAQGLETRLATGDLRGFSPAQLERAANLYRYQAEMARRGKSALTAARRSTSAKLAGLEIPACFQIATEASYARLLTKPCKRRSPADKRDARRLARQSARLAEVVS